MRIALRSPVQMNLRDDFLSFWLWYVRWMVPNRLDSQILTAIAVIRVVDQWRGCPLRYREARTGEE